MTTGLTLVVEFRLLIGGGDDGRGKTTWILCRICNKPVGLTFDTAVDEDGKAVHELCYVRVATHQNGSKWQSLYNDAVAVFR